MAPSKVWSFMFASVLLMLVAACYSEDTEEAIQEPMPGEWMVISPRVLKFAALERTGSEFCCRPGMIRCTTPTQTDSDGRAGSGGDFGESVRTGSLGSEKPRALPNVICKPKVENGMFPHLFKTKYNL
uniref:Uncharacterized protein n=1 Tax=Magallana gigas TaxID=29159 RepID=K1Q0V8_MAGGI